MKDFQFMCFTFLLLANTLSSQEIKPVKINEIKAFVVDAVSGNKLAFANVRVIGTTISTVTNSEGEFSLKVPNEFTNNEITVLFMGYKSKSFAVKYLLDNNNKIMLEPVSIELPEISVISKDAESLVQAVMEKRDKNYASSEMFMTAFYRETIKKNKIYVSLSEAVVDVQKQSYSSYKPDIVRFYKARKKTDYNKLDTLVFKLMGGPFNSLYLDIMKHPSLIFTEDMIENYQFTFDHSTKMDNKLMYVINFVQSKSNQDPLYAGKLFIDAQTMALKTAIFKLNIDDKELSARMFIIKKPFNANVYPIEASYRMDYFEKNGKWYYGYSRIELGLRIDWKKKLFNTTYFSTIEMAVTDGENNSENKPIKVNEKLKPNVIVSEEVSGFSDPEFWGEFNVIEPEKPIQSAIKKIQKQLEKKY